MNLPVGLQNASYDVKQKNEDLPYVPGVTLRALELHWIKQTIKYFNGNKSKAARHLGVSRETVNRKLRNQ